MHEHLLSCTNPPPPHPFNCKKHFLQLEETVYFYDVLHLQQFAEDILSSTHGFIFIVLEFLLYVSAPWVFFVSCLSTSVDSQ
jgi:hypothetical protein